MFKTMTGVLDVKSKPSLEEIEKIPSYIFCRWLSGNPQTVFAANMINQFDAIPIENQYQIVKSAFAGKIKFIPYPKQHKEDIEQCVKNISDYFKISEQKAKEYLNFISSEELEFINNLYI